MSAPGTTTREPSRFRHRLPGTLTVDGLNARADAILDHGEPMPDPLTHSGPLTIRLDPDFLDTLMTIRRTPAGGWSRA